MREALESFLVASRQTTADFGLRIQNINLMVDGASVPVVELQLVRNSGQALWRPRALRPCVRTIVLLARGNTAVPFDTDLFGTPNLC